MNTLTYGLTVPRKIAATVLTLAMVLGWVAWPAQTQAAVIFSEDFGSGSDLADIPGWNEQGSDSDGQNSNPVATHAREGQNSGEDAASPNGGRFAKIAWDTGNPQSPGDDKAEWICIQLDTDGYEDLVLKYYWRGDDDAEDNEDKGYVEYRTTSNDNADPDEVCNSNPNSWETPLKVHELDDGEDGGSVWAFQTVSLPDSLGEEESWFLRFRNHSTTNSEFFRVDGIRIEGDLPNNPPVANNVNVSTDEDVAVGITLDASDPDAGDAVESWEVIIAPLHGNLSASSGAWGAGPHLTYTPNGDFNGEDDFTYRVNDGEADSNVATVEVTVNPVAEVCDQGFHLENDQCVPDEQEPDEPGQCVIVSDTNDYYVEGGTNAVLTWVHDAWADNVTGANWIWGDAEVEDPSDEETQTFTKTFYLEEVPSGGVLEVAADNGALFKINGVTVLDHLTSLQPSDQNYNDPVDSVDVTSELVAGENTIEVTVTNLEYQTEDPHTNPAGLIYKLVVTGSECGEPEPEEEPATCEPGVELLENGNFEVPDVTDPSHWDIFNIIEDLGLGWTAEWLTGDEDAPEIANIELQETGLLGWESTGDGDQWTELDSDWNGHAPGPNGEEGQVAISQTVATVPGETYTLSFDFSPRPGTADTQNTQNVVDVLVNDVVIGTVGPFATVGNQTEWSHHSFSFEADEEQTTVTFRDAGFPNDSLGTFVDNASLTCDEPEPTATVVATKIVCTDESELPNWGAGGPDITETTAQDWVDTHESCRFESDWQFQWVTDADSNTNPGDNILSPAASPWSIFGLTAEDGTVTAEVPVGGKVWVREVLKEGYLPFSGQNTTEHVSAEIYCSTDVLNYDNWDWIDPVEEDQTYYCVAWNVPPEDQCNPEATNVLLSSDNDGEELLTQDESGPASLVSAPHANWTDDLLPALWIWKDTETSVQDADVGTEETFTRTFEIVGTPQDSELTLAADNGVVVEVNGVELVNDPDEHNYTDAGVATYPIAASLLQNGENEITFTITNINHDTANDPSNNPAGLVYRLVVNENECELPPEPTSLVTMCKTNEEGQPLSGWTLMLQGDEIESLAVAVNDPNGSDTVNLLEDGLSYLAVASGLWRNAGQGANWIDAEYSTIDPITPEIWTTPVDGFLGYSTDILELQINETFDPDNAWGPYNSAHVYAQSFIQPSDGPANFRIYDGHPVPTVNAGWYGDNVESTLAVDLYEGYAGVTGEDGCVTFEDVPYGSYSAGELEQEGWYRYGTWDGDLLLEGTSVEVDEETEHFTIQNAYQDEEDNEDTGTLVIIKDSGDEDGTFTFQIGGNESFENVDITTEEGEGEEEVELAPGVYSVTENIPDGWDLVDYSCEYEGESEGVEIQNGEQITIYEDETVTCTFVNEKQDEEVVQLLSGGSGPNHKMGQDDDDGEVLGEETEACGPLLNTFMRMGITNDSGEVTKLQNFLNIEMGSGLPLSGFFGPLTDAAVRSFQLKYWEEVLQPWFGIEGSAIQDADDTTGYVYKTTQRMINNIFCPSLNIPMPELP